MGIIRPDRKNIYKSLLSLLGRFAKVNADIADSRIRTPTETSATSILFLYTTLKFSAFHAFEKLSKVMDVGKDSGEKITSLVVLTEITAIA
jgi:hypothetical protein